MCGVFGFVSYDGQGPDMARLRKIAAATMTRGPHAFGFAWLDWSGRMRMFKKTEAHRRSPRSAPDGRQRPDSGGSLSVGDARRPREQPEQSPAPRRRGLIVRDGVVSNHEDLAAEYDLSGR